MKLNKNTIGFIIGAIIPLAFEFFGPKNHLGDSTILYTFMWAIVNYLFLMTSFEFIRGYLKINRLENLELNKKPYILSIIVYVGFLIFVNIYFIQQMYIRDIQILNILANPIFIVILFLLFLFNLQCGKFPNIDDKETTIYNIAKESSFRDGKDRFGHVIGKYNEGIIVGNNYFPYKEMKSVSKTRNNEIVIKGRENEKNYIVNIGSDKSANAAKDLILQAEKENKIEKNKVNIK